MSSLMYNGEKVILMGESNSKTEKGIEEMYRVQFLDGTEKDVSANDLIIIRESAI